MFRLLYQNEYLNEYDLAKAKRDLKKISKDRNDDTVLADTKKEKSKISKERNLLDDTYFNLESLTIKFPSPQSLNMTTITERINNSRDIIDFIVQTMVSQNDSELQEEFKRSVTKDMLSTFDWTKYEQLLETAKVNKVENAIKAASMEPANDDGGMGGDF